VPREGAHGDTSRTKARPVGYPPRAFVKKLLCEKIADLEALEEALIG